MKQALKNTDEDEWVRLRVSRAVGSMGDPEALPVLLDLARQAEAKVARFEALSTLVSLSGLAGAAPPDPDAPDATALLSTIESWHASEGSRLRWDSPSRTFRP